ncbi:MAG TPA: hypothetical protein VEJ86_09140 [Candidatus Binataceae bacterium]|nr:hypothetical protein [Candidatus Binataceae bacterium]
MSRAKARIGLGAYVFPSAMILSVLLIAPRAAAASAGGNLLVNGDLTAGDKVWPVAWTHYALPGCGTTFNWRRTPGEPAAIEVINDQPVEMGIEQQVTLDPGLYRVSADIRTENVMRPGAGAQLVVKLKDTGMKLDTAELFGDRDWKTVDVYFRVRSRARRVTLGVQLGYRHHLGSGTVAFRNFDLRQVDSAPIGRPVFELEKIWGSPNPDANPPEPLPIMLTAPLASNWVVVLLFVLLFALTFGSWRVLEKESTGTIRKSG